MHEMLKLLKDGYEELLSNLNILSSVDTLIAYLDIINSRISEEISKELEPISIKLVPVITTLSEAGKIRESNEILTCLEGLMTKASYDFARRFYLILKTVVEMNVIKAEPVKTDLEETYQLFFQLVMETEGR